MGKSAARRAEVGSYDRARRISEEKHKRKESLLAKEAVTELAKQKVVGEQRAKEVASTAAAEMERTRLSEEAATTRSSAAIGQRAQEAKLENILGQLGAKTAQENVEVEKGRLGLAREVAAPGVRQETELADILSEHGHKTAARKEEESKMQLQVMKANLPSLLPVATKGIAEAEEEAEIEATMEASGFSPAARAIAKRSRKIVKDYRDKSLLSTFE